MTSANLREAFQRLQNEPDARRRGLRFEGFCRDWVGGVFPGAWKTARGKAAELSGGDYLGQQTTSRCSGKEIQACVIGMFGYTTVQIAESEILCHKSTAKRRSSATIGHGLKLNGERMLFLDNYPSANKGTTSNEALAFERYVLSLIRAEANSSNKTVLIGGEISSELAFVDAFAPDGLEGLVGPCVIEVKLKPRPNSIVALLNRLMQNEATIATVLVLTDFPEAEIRKILLPIVESRTKESSLMVKVEGKAFIDRLAEKYPDVALINGPQHLKGAIHSFEKSDRSKNNMQKIASLRSAFREDRLVLEIGAGVPKSAAFPDWATLIKKLAQRFINENLAASPSQPELDELFKLFEHEMPKSPLIVARLLSDAMGEKFTALVKNELYPTGYTTATTTLSSLLESISALCAPERGHTGLVGVVNYNFDDLLQTALSRHGIRYNTIVSESDRPSSNELPIYHVHGFLPSDGVISDTQKQALVLSEGAYHQQFIDPYSWVNITPLHLLSNYVCLFVGFSMTDPNLRRLLEISQSKNPGPRHYAILRDHWNPSRLPSVSADMGAVGRVFRGLEETSLLKLGVSVLWVEEHAEIPALIRSIRQ